MVNTKAFNIYTVFIGIDRMSRVADNMGRNMLQLATTFNNSEKTIHSAYNNIGKGMITLSQNFRGAFYSIAAAAAVGVLGLTHFMKKYAEMESKTLQMSTLLGGMPESKKFVKGVQQFAIDTPLSFLPALEAAGLILQSRRTPKQTMQDLDMLGNLASGRNETFINISRAYGRVLNDRVDRQTIRPFETAGIPIFDAMAKTIGVPRSKLDDMIKAGDVSAKMFYNSLKFLTSEGQGFFNRMSVAMNSVDGQFSKMTESTDLFSIAIGGLLAPTAMSSFSQIANSFIRMTDNIKSAFQPLSNGEPNERAKELKATLGQIEDILTEHILPSMEKFVDETIQGTSWLNKLVDSLEFVVKNFEIISKWVVGSAIFIAIGSALTWIINTGIAVWAIFKSIGVISLLIGGNIATMGGAIGAAFVAHPIAGAVALTLAFIIATTEVLKNMDSIKAWFESMKPLLQDFTDFMVEAIWGSIKKIASEFWQPFKVALANDPVIEYFTFMWSFTSDFLKSQTVAGAFENFGIMIAGFILSPFLILLDWIEKIPGTIGDVAGQIKQDIFKGLRYEDRIEPLMQYRDAGYKQSFLFGNYFSPQGFYKETGIKIEDQLLATSPSNSPFIRPNTNVLYPILGNTNTNLIGDYPKPDFTELIIALKERQKIEVVVKLEKDDDEIGNVPMGVIGTPTGVLAKANATNEEIEAALLANEISQSNYMINKYMFNGLNPVINIGQ